MTIAEMHFAVILAVFKRHDAAGLPPPSIRELMPELGIKSASSAHYYLNRLVEQGDLHQLPGTSRGYFLDPKHWARR